MRGMSHSVSDEDIRSLIADKYEGNTEADMTEDLVRLEKGEPLAYVIGWIPFLSLYIYLDSHPLIPRPETEWWTEVLIKHLKEKFGDGYFTFLDLCAGSGAVGLSILAAFPRAKVYFSELEPAHISLIEKNIMENGLDESRAVLMCGDLFDPLKDESVFFDIIATNPPYIPSERVLDTSVTEFEPALALYSGKDGLDLIRQIASEVSYFIKPEGQLWLECDTSHIQEVAELLESGDAKSTEIRTDQYDRERFVIGYY